jgi:hypothetical protein
MSRRKQDFIGLFINVVLQLVWTTVCLIIFALIILAGLITV